MYLDPLLSSTKNVVRLAKLSGSANDQCAMCASSRRQSYFIHAGAAAHLQKSPLFVSSCLQGVHWGRGGGLSDGMKKIQIMR